MKTPNTKLQTPKNLQISISNQEPPQGGWDLMLGIYELRITIYARQSQITLGVIMRVLESFKSAIVNRKSKI